MALPREYGIWHESLVGVAPRASDAVVLTVVVRTARLEVLVRVDASNLQSVLHAHSEHVLGAALAADHLSLLISSTRQDLVVPIAVGAERF